MIVIDWGSSSFRAYRLNAGFAVIDEKVSTAGVSKVEKGAFSASLIAQVGDWIRNGEKKILMSGMVGSRHGWREVPYVPLPAGIEQICQGVISFAADSLEISIVPGLCGEDESHVPDVIRGEETELMGCMGLSSLSTVCLPGTHSKWVQLEHSKITSLRSYMSGELFEAIRGSTVLGRFMATTDDESGFERGVQRSKEPGGLSHHLFGIRSLVLQGELPSTAATSYLSGLIIGHEIREVAPACASIHLVGNVDLCARYSRAMSSIGLHSTIEPAGAALRGLTAIARTLAWS